MHSSVGQHRWTAARVMSLCRVLSRKGRKVKWYFTSLPFIWTQAGKIPLAQDKLFDGQLVITVHLGWSLIAALCRGTQLESPFSLCFYYYTSVNCKYVRISSRIVGTGTALTTADLTLMYQPSQWPHGGRKHSCLLYYRWEREALHHPVAGGRWELDLNLSGANDWIIVPQLMPLVCRIFKKVSVIYSLHGYYKSLVFLDLWQMSISFFFTMRSRGSNQWASTIQRHRVPPGESVQYLQDENWYFKTVTSTLFYLYCELSEQKL